MVNVRIVLVLLPIMLMAGCSGKLQTNAGLARAGCEEAVAQGVSAGQASARLVAQTNLTHQAQDLRGFMIKDGYRAVRARRPQVDCRPYSLGFGLTRCVAKAQLCGD